MSDKNKGFTTEDLFGNLTRPLGAVPNSVLAEEVMRRMGNHRVDIAPYLFEMLLPEHEYDEDNPEHQAVASLAQDLIEYVFYGLHLDLTRDVVTTPFDAIQKLSSRIQKLETENRNKGGADDD